MFPHESLPELAPKKSKQQVNPKTVVWRITLDSCLQFKNSFSLQDFQRISSPAFRICPSFGTGRINKWRRRHQGGRKILRTETNLCFLQGLQTHTSLRSRKIRGFFLSLGSVYFGAVVLQRISRATENFFRESKPSSCYYLGPLSLRAAEWCQLLGFFCTDDASSWCFLHNRRVSCCADFTTSATQCTCLTLWGRGRCHVPQYLCTPSRTRWLSSRASPRFWFFIFYSQLHFNTKPVSFEEKPKCDSGPCSVQALICMWMKLHQNLTLLSYAVL